MINPDDDVIREVSRDELRAMLAEMVGGNIGVVRKTKAQQLLDELARECLVEDEIELGYSIGLLHGMRVANQHGLALETLFLLAIDLGDAGMIPRPPEAD